VAPIEQCFHSVKMTLRRNRASLTAHNLGEMIADVIRPSVGVFECQLRLSSADVSASFFAPYNLP
jgi:hypothetical protein